MEVANCPHAQKQNLQTSGRKVNSGSQKDLWLVVRDGSLSDVESALASLKNSGGNINLRNTFGLTPLHVAAWRNHIPIVKTLLAAGADPDATKPNPLLNLFFGQVTSPVAEISSF